MDSLWKYQSVYTWGGEKEKHKEKKKKRDGKRGRAENGKVMERGGKVALTVSGEGQKGRRYR